MNLPRTLSEHEVLIFVLQFALLLGSARLLGELMKRLGQAMVLGELLAGMLLGPSVLGALSPKFYQWIFPAQATQIHLLELVSFLGMIFLLVSSGIETDLKILKNLGKPAFWASAFGLIVPFIFGFVLALYLPDVYLVEPQRRILFSCFLGIVMAVTAVPVIAKILMDLDVLRRNIGAIILASGVMQDLVSYTAFSLIVALAAKSSAVTPIVKTLLGMVLLLLILGTVGYRFIFRLVKWVDDRALTAGAHTTLLMVVTLVFAAITHFLGMHAVFGALMAGLILASAPRMRPAALEHVKTITESIFAPVFFAYVGLRVNFLALQHWDLFIRILLVAIFSKILGSMIGGKIGKLNFWESLALGIGTTARGGMEMIVALIAFSVGLVNSEMYTVIVLMAMATSLMAPPLLRLVLPRIHMSDEEKLRLKMEKDQEKVIFQKKHLRILIPTGGGPNARKAIELALPLGYFEDTSITTLFVSPRKRKFKIPFLKSSAPAEGISSHQELVKNLGEKYRVSVQTKTISAEKDFAEEVVKEVDKGYDIVFLGASGFRHILYSEHLGRIIGHSPAHIAVVKARDQKSRYRSLLVPTRGDYYSKLALEFALMYAEPVRAEITLFHVVRTGQGLFLGGETVLEGPSRKLIQDTLAYESHPSLAQQDRVKIRPKVVEGESAQTEILKELSHGDYDLLILGAENRSLTPDLNLGFGAEYLIENAPCTVVTLIPRAIRAKR